MFTYNTRTELLPEGTKFIEKDIILFDYSYTGDISFQVDASLQTPGFGFVIQEDDNSDRQTAENIVLITFSNDNSYKVILKNGGEQVTIANQFIEAAVNLYDPAGTTFIFKKHNEVLSVYKGVRMDDGHFEEIRLMTYHMQYDMDNYWIGIYSNAGNTVRFASVQTEAPSNWVANVINAGGGRIKWIRDGFTIEEAEYDIEVEAEEVPMKPGKYWFDYETDNPDMKAYIFPAERKHTGTKRKRSQIATEMSDEEKNRIQIDNDGDKFIEITKDCTVNIKFKGKWGTVRNICLKNDKRASFIETSFNSTVRPGSRLCFDLTKISKIYIKGTIWEIPIKDIGEAETYSIFRRGKNNIDVRSPLTLGEEHVFTFTANDGKITLDGQLWTTFSDTSDTLYAFENVTADITDFVITMTDREEFNILLQKTIKVTIPNTIDSPILVTDEADEPLDLSSSHRLLAIVNHKLELFNALNGITLQYVPDITKLQNIKIYGVPYSMQTLASERKPIIHKNAETIEEMAEYYTEIPFTPDPVLLLQRIIKIPYSVRSQYQYIIVSYDAIESHRYIFTNWAREIYDLEESTRIYLSAPALNLDTDVVVYGIPDAALFNKDLLYYIPDDDFEKSIDMSAYSYDVLMKQKDYDINKLQKVIVDTDTLKRYKYLVIDYLKRDSYAINEKEEYYQIDIVPSGTKVNIYYDADKETGTITQHYQVLSIDNMLVNQSDKEIHNGDFVTLELTE